MALILRSVIDFYNHLFTTLKDPRAEALLFTGVSPLPLITILTAFIVLCKFGPILMESRKPFELKSLMTFYNFTQVVLNTILGCKAVYILFWKYKYNFKCQLIDFSTTEHGMAEINLCHSYFLVKILDLSDTVFIVLKKNNQQLSFLHCYHHFFILLGSYVATKWLPGGPFVVLGITNTFVHSVMYFYYFLTAFKPELKKSIWWKKYITQIQLAQFAFVALHILKTALDRSCEFPKTFAWMLFIQNFFMLALFGDFYIKVYLRKKAKE